MGEMHQAVSMKTELQGEKKASLVFTKSGTYTPEISCKILFAGKKTTSKKIICGPAVIYRYLWSLAVDLGPKKNQSHIYTSK